VRPVDTAACPCTGALPSRLHRTGLDEGTATTGPVVRYFPPRRRPL